MNISDTAQSSVANTVGITQSIKFKCDHVAV